MAQFGGAAAQLIEVSVVQFGGAAAQLIDVRWLSLEVPPLS